MRLKTIQNRRPERAIAWMLGDAHYYTGKQCKHGHVAMRNVVDASCVACRTVFREGYRDEARQYAQVCRDIITMIDPVGTRDAWAKWQREERQRDPEKFRARERRLGAKYRKMHPQRKLAATRKRQAQKLKRTPPWADIKAISKFYQNCPAGYEVDHIIPLRGKTVSGLHVLKNLQYLTKDANRAKGCKFLPELEHTL